MTRKFTVRCDRCKKRARVQHLRDITDWSVHFDDNGRMSKLVCDGCTTDIEYAETVVHESTMDMSTITVDDSGSFSYRPKAL